MVYYSNIRSTLGRGYACDLTWRFVGEQGVGPSSTELLTFIRRQRIGGQSAADGAGVPLSDLTSYPELERAAALPVGAGRLLESLGSIDTATLDAGGQIRLAQQWARIEAVASGRKLTAIAAMAGPEPDPAENAGQPGFTDYEVATALSLGAASAQRLTTAARTLAARMTGALAALCSGELHYLQALRYAEAAENLTDDQCARVEELTLGKAATKTPWELRQLLRKAVVRVGAEDFAKRHEREKKTTHVSTFFDDHGMGELTARMTAVDLHLIEVAVEHWARAAKAGGDERSLDELRVAALVTFAERYLKGDPVPRSHGRPITVNIAMDLPTFLGLTDHPGEILGTGQLIPADALRDLIPQAALRRIITDPMTGHLLDYGRSTYRFPPDLAGYLVAKWVTSTGPGSTVPAERGDIDHGRPWDEAGDTDRNNGNPCNRRWHRAKTIGDWTVTDTDDGWSWRSPLGISYTTSPHDYRLGP